VFWYWCLFVLQDAYRLQLKLFLFEVKQQQLLSGVRNFLKLYSSISIGKLATYIEVDEPTLRTVLMTYKHKTHAVNSKGNIISHADIDFYIVEDVLHIIESKPAKRYGDYFIKQILKYEGLITELERVRLDWCRCSLHFVSTVIWCVFNWDKNIYLFGENLIRFLLWLLLEYLIIFKVENCMHLMMVFDEGSLSDSHLKNLE